MFNGVSQLSEPNKLLIHASFVAQAPSVWDYQWVSAGVLTTDNSKSSLQGALSEWCANAMEAEEVHGHVSTWDVTAVTDMSSLLAGSCRFTFNEDVNAWDVGQVTNMNVRRRALRQGHRAPARTQLWGPQAMCVCWRGAVYVLWSERFQPACGSLGCRPVDQHGGAPPPCVRVTGLHT